MGSFASIPSVFDGIEEGVKHSVKIEFSSEFKEDALESNNRFLSLPLQLETVFSTDWLLARYRSSGSVRLRSTENCKRLRIAERDSS